MSKCHLQPPVVLIISDLDRTAYWSLRRPRPDAEVLSEFEYWLRTLSDVEHRAALAKYRQLMARFPGLLMREGYIAAAKMVRRV